MFSDHDLFIWEPTSTLSQSSGSKQTLNTQLDRNQTQQIKNERREKLNRRLQRHYNGPRLNIQKTNCKNKTMSGNISAAITDEANNIDSNEAYSVGVNKRNENHVNKTTDLVNEMLPHINRDTSEQSHVNAKSENVNKTTLTVNPHHLHYQNNDHHLPSNLFTCEKLQHNQGRKQCLKNLQGLSQMQAYLRITLTYFTTIVIGLLLTQSGIRAPMVEGSPISDMYRQWLHEDDPTLHAAKLEDFYREKNLTSGTLDIEVFVNNLTLEVKVDGKRVMYMYNETTRSSPTTFRLVHRGVGVVVLHPSTGKVMLTSHFGTDQPRSHKSFLETLNNLQAGRILILAAPGDWRGYMSDEAMDLLKIYLGGFWVRHVCIGEMWVGVGRINGPLWIDVATTISNFTGMRSSPIHVAVTVPLSPKEDHRCDWYKDPTHEKRAKFCETYEGYGDFCSCNTTKIISPSDAPPLEMKEEIPVVIATSRHQFGVLRQLEALWSQRGGGNTSILLSVDGTQNEAKEFGEVMGLQTVFHINPAALRTLARISQHIKFSIYQAFLLNPKAEKLIILEDDLILSPDFLSYFHQTAPLLDADKTIYCINAYNYNSFLPTVTDTSKLYREEVLPAYGWMMTRELSKEILPDWLKLRDFSDWDWYMRYETMKGRTIITPQIPRTYHNGHGGFHISGWEQSAYFDRRPINMDPNATVDISYLTNDAYEEYLEAEIKNATVVEITEHPCDKKYFPEEEVGNFVVYYYHEYEKDEHFNFYTLVACLNGYDRGRMEHHRLLYSYGYYGNDIYIIGCPGSYYCRVKDEDYDRLVYKATKEDLNKSIKYKQQYVKHMTHRELAVRYPPDSISEEVNMRNIIYYTTNYLMAEVDDKGNLMM